MCDIRPKEIDPAVLELAPRDVHVWLCHPDESRDLPEARLQWLPMAERQRLRDFVFDPDRRRYATARLVVRDILSRYVAHPGGDLRFTTGPCGAPALVTQPLHPLGPVNFNISHTSGLVAVAVRRGARVGIDVECGDRVLDVVRMGRFLSSTDRRTLSAVRPDARMARFIDLWTLKESHIKARGLGLRLLPRFGIDFPTPDTVAMRIDADIDEPSSAWWLGQFHLPSGHVLALCTDRAPVGGPTVVARRIDLSGTCGAIPLAPVRRSPP